MDSLSASADMVNAPRRAPDGGPLLEWLTDRQYETLVALNQYVLDERRYPTARELAQRLSRPGASCSTQRAQMLIEALIKKGYLVKNRGHRSWQMTDAAIEKLRRDADGAQQGLPGM